jgi:hypothetical protein
MNTKLIGHYNPFLTYPAPVVPIVRSDDGGKHAVYYDSGHPDLVAIPDDSPLVPHDRRLSSELESYEIGKHKLFALDASSVELVLLSDEQTFYRRVLSEGHAANENPFVHLLMAKRTNDSAVISRAIRVCYVALASENARYADNWYVTLPDEHLRLLGLPGDPCALFESCSTVNLGCAPDTRDMVSLLCNVVNGKQIESHEGRQVLVRCLSLPMDNAVGTTPSEQFAIVCPPSEEWLEQRGLYRIGDVLHLCSCDLFLAIKPGIGENIRQWEDVFNIAVTNPDFTWVRARQEQDYELGRLTSMAVYGAAESLSRQYGWSLSKTVTEIERRVIRYLPTDAEAADFAVQEGGWKVSAFVAQRSTIQRAFKGLPDEEQPLLVPYPALAGEPGTHFGLNHSMALLTDGGADRTVFDAIEALVQTGQGQAIIRASGFSIGRLTTVRALLERSQYAQKRVFSASEMVGSLARPITVCLVADISGSMRGHKLEQAKSAMWAFLGLMRPSRGDALALVAFSDVPRVIVPIRRLGDPGAVEELGRAIATLEPAGGTALRDALVRAVGELLDYQDGIKVLVLLSDGLENSSRSRVEEFRQQLQTAAQANIFGFGLAYGDDADYSVLTEMSTTTGGATLEGTPESIVAVLQRLARML